MILKNNMIHLHIFNNRSSDVTNLFIYFSLHGHCSFSQLRTWHMLPFLCALEAKIQFIYLFIFPPVEIAPKHGAWNYTAIKQKELSLITTTPLGTT